MKNLATALDKFHQLVPNIPKDSKNPFFNSKYAALDSILPAIKDPLHKAGLVVTQFPSGDHGLRSILIHTESGEFLEETFSMKPSKDDPQGRGAAITYARRFALVSILGLNTDEDDDGNGASTKPPTPKQEPKQETPKQDPPSTPSKFTGKPNLKKLFEAITAAGKTPEDFMEAAKWKARIPATADDFFKMKDVTAARFVEEFGYIHDEIIEWAALQKP